MKKRAVHHPQNKLDDPLCYRKDHCDVTQQNCQKQLFPPIFFAIQILKCLFGKRSADPAASLFNVLPREPCAPCKNRNHKQSQCHDDFLFSLRHSAFFVIRTAIPVTRAVISVCPALFAKAVHCPIPPVAAVCINTIRAVACKSSFRQSHDHSVFHVKILLDIQFRLLLS